MRKSYLINRLQSAYPDSDYITADTVTKQAATTTRPVTDILGDLRETVDNLLGRAERIRWEAAGAVQPV